MSVSITVVDTVFIILLYLYMWKVYRKWKSLLLFINVQ